MNIPFTSVGKVPEVKDLQAIVFHDRNGKIRHMHYFIVLEGARAVKKASMKQQALEQAESHGVDVGKLQTLHVSNVKNPQAMHRVDLKGKKLVEIATQLPPFTPKPIKKQK